MNKRDTHKHRHKHNHPQDDKEKRQAALRLQDQCKLVNKIASIDIWATERLYKKWKRQALAQRSSESPQESDEAERLTLRNYNASEQQLCKRHASIGCGKYLKASLGHSTGAKLITTTGKIFEVDGGRRSRDTAPEKQRRAQSRPPEVSRRKAQHQHQHQVHRRHMSLSSDKNASHSHYQCQHRKRQQQQNARQSERTSDIDWPDSWPSIWGSSAPKCEQRSSNGKIGRTPTDEAEAADNKTGCRDCWTEDKHHKHQTMEAASVDRQRDKESRRHRRSGSRPPGNEHRRRRTSAKHSDVCESIVEALITIDSTELSSMRSEAPLKAKRNKHRGNRRQDQSSDSQIQNLSHSNSPPKLYATRTRNKVSPSQQTSKTQQRLLDQSTYTIVRNDEGSPKKHRQRQHSQSRKNGHYEFESTAAAVPNGSYSMARMSRSDRHPVEQVEQLSKPVVWLMTEDPTAEEVLIRQNDNSTVKSNVAVDNCIVANTTAAGTTRRTVANPTLRRLALREFAADTVACHNSLGAKSLQMLSTGTNERELDAQSSGLMCEALVSNVRPSMRYKQATCHFPKIMMQSNVTVNDTNAIDTMSDDFDGIIETHQEMGESKGVEPKTGSVSRYVQDEVLKAAKLVATMGFAGLVGNRRSDLITDPNTTDTIGTADDDDDNEELDYDDEHENDRDSLSELDDLEDIDDEGDDFDFDEDTEKDEDSDARRPQRRPTSQSRRPRKDADKRSKRSTSRQGGDKRARDYSRSPRQKAASKKPLPMTQCPTTQHRIECYKTRSGRVKCYMTARHPVKCRVQGGRIVCKATVNAESSNLPYPCNAAWQ